MSARWPALRSPKEAPRSPLIPPGVLERSDVVVTMVFGPKEIEQVLRAPDGLLSTACRGKSWIDLTTSSPKLMRGLAKQFHDQGGRAIS